jgi:competence protein ComEC
MFSAPSMAVDRLQTRMKPIIANPLLCLENWLEKERDQLPLWLPVMVGSGIAAWFLLPKEEYWIGFVLASVGIAAFGVLLGLPKRLGLAVALSGTALALGCGLIWARAERVDHDVLARPALALVSGVIEKAENKSAEGKLRLTVRNHSTGMRVRVTMKTDAPDPRLKTGAEISFRARLAPPPKAALPGGYDFSQAAWFMQLGAVGQMLGEVTFLHEAPPGNGLRDRLTAHVNAQIPGSAGGIASAFASGDRGAISPQDEEAMRASGLTHLLSISGLHVTAVVAATMFLVLKTLALWPRLALNWPLLTLSAGAGAAVGVCYTLLTGAEVPTIRSCIAAILVLFGIALGREALTLRLVATGAIFVLIIWPESLVGASFQLSFMAITAIVAFHDSSAIKAKLARREESYIRRGLRAIGGLLLTGLVVEVALAPIALYHFHKSGLYGALANLIAIPLTTFIIMPFEALALLFDSIGAGAPFWWMTEQAIAILLWIAHHVAGFPGAMARLPSMPTLAFALMLFGGLWLILWKTSARIAGAVPLLVGAIWAVSNPAPDLLITDDGRHMALRDGNGNMALLRERTGDFIRDVMAERSGVDVLDQLIENRRDSDCSTDICVTSFKKGDRTWMIGATRSQHLVPWKDLISLCPKLDILVSERSLPPSCHPKWLKVDRDMLAKTGGLAITFYAEPIVETAKGDQTDHPWNVSQYRRSKPASLP